MFIIGIAIIGLINMFLWNALIPDLFHGPTISYLQAVGLSVLARLLVGRGNVGGRHWRKWKHRGRDRWRERATQKWGHAGKHWDSGEWWSQAKREQWKNFKNMSPEERERMKREWACDFKSRYSKTEETPKS